MSLIARHHHHDPYPLPCYPPPHLPPVFRTQSDRFTIPWGRIVSETLKVEEDDNPNGDGYRHSIATKSGHWSCTVRREAASY